MKTIRKWTFSGTMQSVKNGIDFKVQSLSTLF